MNLLPSGRIAAPRLAHFLIVLLALAPAAIRGAEAPAAVHPFEKDIAAFEAADQKNPPPRGAILFVGDSQFARWNAIHDDLPGYTLIRRGFGGSRMSDLLYFTDRVVLPYHARLIVINEGGNDLHSGRTPEQLLANIKAFVEKVQAAQPEARLIFCGLTPSPARWSEVPARKAANEMIKGYLATRKNTVFLELFDNYLGPDGKPPDALFVEDHLHHSAEGYKVRVKALLPLLGEPDAKGLAVKP
jgi:lysophospholipase L1-like esterase